MTASNCLRLIASLFIGLATTSSLSAQTAAVQAQYIDDHPAGDVEQGGAALPDAPDAVQYSSSPMESTQNYVPALNGTGLIALGDALKTHVLIGATSSGGWDSNPDDQDNGAASGVFAISPYLGVQLISGKTRSLFQYQPTIQRFTLGEYSGGTLNVASASILHNINERWRWDFKAIGNYGQDSVRLLAPQQTQAVGNVPGASPQSTAYLPNAGILTYISGESGLHYDRSERDSIELQLSNGYSKYSGLNEESGVATSTVNYRRSISPDFGFLTYAQTSYYYESITCKSYGVGAGINWGGGGSTSLSLAGGPQLNSKACGQQQGFAYSAAFSTRLTETSQIYSTASRQITTTYLGPGLWQQIFTVGYQREITHSSTLSADVGYTSSPPVQNVSSYNGKYFDVIYNQHISSAFTTSVTYRSYSGNWGVTSFSRNIAMVSLSWTPGAGHANQ